MMLPGMMGPGGPGGPMGLMGGAPQGAAQNDTFATGMLAGLGLREMSQLLGLSKKGKAQQPGGGMELPAADQLAGQLGDIDKLIILSRLMGQSGAAPGAGAGPMPLGPAAPPPGASPLGGNPALAALMASRGAAPGGPPMGGPMGSPMGPMGPGGPMPGGPPMGPMGAPARPPIAGGGVSLVPMLLNQLLSKSSGLV